MKFLLDAQLPPRLAAAMVRAGHLAWHVHDCGLNAAKDRDVLRFAVRQGAAIVTAEPGFAMAGPPVVWLRVGSGGSSDALLRALPKIAGALEAGERVVEVR